MGTLSAELKMVKGYLDKALKVINSKYKANGLPEESSMVVSQLPEFIEKINAVNPSNGTTIDAILCEEFATMEIPEGWHNKGNVRIQTQEKIGIPSNHLVIVEPDDYHVLSRVFIEGDVNLNPANIKEGVSIFGVVGELEEIKSQEKTGTPSTSPVVVTPDDGFLLSKVTIEGDENLIPTNIKKDVTIFGVTGTLEMESEYYNIVYVVNIEQHIAYKQTVKHGDAFNIIQTIPTHSNAVMDFQGWSPSHTATTPTYHPGDAINTNLADKGDTAILYAVWHENKAPSAPSLAFTYNNNACINMSTGTETGNIIITPGMDPESGTVINTLECISENASNVVLTKLSETVYSVIYKQPSVYVFLATTTDEKGLSNSCAGTSIIYGADGVFAGSGVFEVVGEDGVFTSDKSEFIKGCYISSVTLNITIGNGHSNSGKDDRVDFYLYDSDGNQETVTVFEGNFGSSLNKIQKTYTVSDDIRQIQFYAVTPGHESCIEENSIIAWDIQYAFDMDLYNKEK